MNPYDARASSSSMGLDRYVSGIETDDGLQRLASNVKAYNDLCHRRPARLSVRSRGL
jgi:hypothetical protein